MSRAKRHYVPGHVWHITHRCHKRTFLLKFTEGFETYEQLKQAHLKWVDSAIQDENKGREAKWTQSIAVGSKPFIEKIKQALGFKAIGRKIRGADDSFELRETMRPYGSKNDLEHGNTFIWNQ